MDASLMEAIADDPIRRKVCSEKSFASGRTTWMRSE